MTGKRKGKSREDGISTLESGDIYFVYRPRVQQKSAEGLEDVQRMHVILHPNGEKRYRLTKRLKRRQISLPICA